MMCFTNEASATRILYAIFTYGNARWAKSLLKEFAQTALTLPKQTALREGHLHLLLPKEIKRLRAMINLYRPLRLIERREAKRREEHWG